MYSILIQKAQIIDGTGHEGWIGDVAIEGDSIVEIAPHINIHAKEVIDGQGLMLTPGFIDMQNHSDSYWQLFDTPSLDSLITQGYTTILVGQCGASLAPVLSPGSLLPMQKWHTLDGANINWTSFDEFAKDFSKRNYGCNIASLVGYATLRRGLIGDAVRSLTAPETDALRRILWESLEAGAFGLSTGLSYAHEIIISELELYDLAQIVAKEDALLSVHLRNEGSEIVESIAEAVDLCMHTGVNLKISHLKIKDLANWHHFNDAITTLENAYHQGLKINFDVYPYDSIWQPLYTYLPKWASLAGRAELLTHLENPAQKKKILAHLHNSQVKFSEMMVASTAHPLSIHSKTIGSIARNLGLTSEETVLEILKTGGSEVLVFDRCLSPDQVTELLEHPLGFVATDGAGFKDIHQAGGLANKLVHPRCFGSAPKFLQEVLQNKHIPIEEAIRKLTGGPASKLGLSRRGSIVVGNFADLVLFSPGEIQSKATYKDPYAYADGIQLVMVNGNISVRRGAVVGSHGKFLRKEK